MELYYLAGESKTYNGFIKYENVEQVKLLLAKDNLITFYSDAKSDLDRLKRIFATYKEYVPFKTKGYYYYIKDYYKNSIEGMNLFLTLFEDELNKLKN